jgi:hypothetical protein
MSSDSENDVWICSRHRHRQRHCCRRHHDHRHRVLHCTTFMHLIDAPAIRCVTALFHCWAVSSVVVCCPAASVANSLAASANPQRAAASLLLCLGWPSSSVEKSVFTTSHIFCGISIWGQFFVRYSPCNHDDASYLLCCQVALVLLLRWR